MKHCIRLSTLMVTILILSSCAEMPALLTPFEDDKPDYARGSSGPSAAESRAPLDVPPSLMGEVEVPTPGAVASQSGELPEYAKKTVAGKAVALDAKLYQTDAANVFSAVIDAMTALNLPVESVDSPSGTVTTDWIRQDSVSSSAQASIISGMFGGDGVQGLRYRFVVRVLRQMVKAEAEAEGVQQTRLEIRTIGQVYVNRHWVNRALQRKASAELFSAVDERLQVDS